MLYYATIRYYTITCHDKKTATEALYNFTCNEQGDVAKFVQEQAGRFDEPTPVSEGRV